MMQQTTIEEPLQLTLEKANELETLLNKINGIKVQKLEEETNPSQYLDLLASILYSLNAITHSYAHLKSQTVPQQFNSVKEYYQKIKGQNKKADGPTLRVNKQAVGRIIKRTISRQPSALNNNS